MMVKTHEAKEKRVRKKEKDQTKERKRLQRLENIDSGISYFRGGEWAIKQKDKRAKQEEERSKRAEENEKKPVKEAMRLVMDEAQRVLEAKEEMIKAKEEMIKAKEEREKAEKERKRAKKERADRAKKQRLLDYPYSLPFYRDIKSKLAKLGDSEKEKAEKISLCSQAFGIPDLGDPKEVSGKTFNRLEDSYIERVNRLIVIYESPRSSRPTSLEAQQYLQSRDGILSEWKTVLLDHMWDVNPIGYNEWIDARNVAHQAGRLKLRTKTRAQKAALKVELDRYEWMAFH
jgi:hypothetical protein